MPRTRAAVRPMEVAPGMAIARVRPGARRRARGRRGIAKHSVTSYERTRYYRFGRLFERVGWLLVATIVVAAALGAFGGGWLSEREVASADGSFAAQFERFWRAGTPSDLEVRWRAPAGEATVWIETAYLRNFVVDVVMPPPVRVAIGADRILYTFLVEGDAAEAHATFRLSARESGSFGGSLGLAGGQTVSIRQRLYP